MEEDILPPAPAAESTAACRFTDLPTSTTSSLNILSHQILGSFRRILLGQVPIFPVAIQRDVLSVQHHDRVFQQSVDPIHVEFVVFHGIKSGHDGTPQKVGPVDHEEDAGEKVFAEPVRSEHGQVQPGGGDEVVPILHDQRLVGVEGEHLPPMGRERVHSEDEGLEEAVPAVPAGVALERRRLLQARRRVRCSESSDNRLADGVGDQIVDRTGGVQEVLLTEKKDRDSPCIKTQANSDDAGPVIRLTLRGRGNGIVGGHHWFYGRDGHPTMSPRCVRRKHFQGLTQPALAIDEGGVVLLGIARGAASGGDKSSRRRGADKPRIMARRRCRAGHRHMREPGRSGRHGGCGRRGMEGVVRAWEDRWMGPYHVEAPLSPCLGTSDAATSERVTGRGVTGGHCAVHITACASHPPPGISGARLITR